MRIVTNLARCCSGPLECTSIFAVDRRGEMRQRGPCSSPLGVSCIMCIMCRIKATAKRSSWQAIDLDLCRDCLLRSYSGIMRPTGREYFVQSMFFASSPFFICVPRWRLLQNNELSTRTLVFAWHSTLVRILHTSAHFQSRQASHPQPPRHGSNDHNLNHYTEQRLPTTTMQLLSTSNITMHG